MREEVREKRISGVERMLIPLHKSWHLCNPLRYGEIHH